MARIATKEEYSAYIKEQKHDQIRKQEIKQRISELNFQASEEFRLSRTEEFDENENVYACAYYGIKREPMIMNPWMNKPINKLTDEQIRKSIDDGNIMFITSRYYPDYCTVCDLRIVIDTLWIKHAIKNNIAIDSFEYFQFVKERMRRHRFVMFEGEWCRMYYTSIISRGIQYSSDDVIFAEIYNQACNNWDENPDPISERCVLMEVDPAVDSIIKDYISDEYITNREKYIKQYCKKAGYSKVKNVGNPFEDFKKNNYGATFRYQTPCYLPEYRQDSIEMEESRDKSLTAKQSFRIFDKLCTKYLDQYNISLWRFNVKYDYEPYGDNDIIGIIE